MAAPESPPELSVVQGERGARPLGTPPRPAPAPAAPTPHRSEGWRVPWWVVAVVAVIGAILFFDQFQRAGRLEERVTALTAELAQTGQQLEQARQQVAAHQAHLDLVRAGLGELGARVSVLQALAERDPLAPPVAPESGAADAAAAQTDVAPEPDVTAVASEAFAPAGEPEASATEPESPAAAPEASATDAEPSGALTDAEGYFWRAERSPSAGPLPPAR